MNRHFAEECAQTPSELLVPELRLHPRERLLCVGRWSGGTTHVPPRETQNGEPVAQQVSTVVLPKGNKTVPNRKKPKHQQQVDTQGMEQGSSDQGRSQKEAVTTRGVRHGAGRVPAE